MACLLDANVFIEAGRRHYGFDFCPAFWQWLIRENAQGRVLGMEDEEFQDSAFSVLAREIFDAIESTAVPSHSRGQVVHRAGAHYERGGFPAFTGKVSDGRAVHSYVGRSCLATGLHGESRPP